MERIPEFIANHLFLFSLFIAILSLLLWNIFSATGVQQLSPARITGLINHENAIVIDVRSAKEFADGHIINAINIIAEKLIEKEQKFLEYKDKTVIICCSRGQDSIRVARNLAPHGAAKIYCLQGGINAWRDNNFPLAKENT